MGGIGWTVYDILASALTAAIGYVVIYLTGVIRSRVQNDVAAGLLTRLTESVGDAVAAVNQQQQELVRKAKLPQSPGGYRLTKQEAALLRQSAIRYVKSYWGPKGLRMLARVLADGERDQDRAAAQVDRVIEAKIEAAVRRGKQRAGSIATKIPAIH